MIKMETSGSGRTLRLKQIKSGQDRNVIDSKTLVNYYDLASYQPRRYSM